MLNAFRRSRAPRSSHSGPVAPAPEAGPLSTQLHGQQQLSCSPTRHLSRFTTTARARLPPPLFCHPFCQCPPLLLLIASSFQATPPAAPLFEPPPPPPPRAPRPCRRLYAVGRCWRPLLRRRRCSHTLSLLPRPDIFHSFHCLYYYLAAPAALPLLLLVPLALV